MIPLDIALQFDVWGPAALVFSIIGALIWIIWGMLNKKIEEIKKSSEGGLNRMNVELEKIDEKVKEVEKSNKTSIEDVNSNISKLSEKMNEKFEQVLEKMSGLALDNANWKSAVFERFVTKEECEKCQKK